VLRSAAAGGSRDLAVTLNSIVGRQCVRQRVAFFGLDFFTPRWLSILSCLRGYSTQRAAMAAFAKSCHSDLRIFCGSKVGDRADSNCLFK
jgi:hypothetical protein